MGRTDDVLKTIEKERIIAIIRCSSDEEALKLAEAIREGGIKIIEITMTVPKAIRALRELSDREDVTIGAGTVLEPSTAAMCIAEGAKFIVSPTLDEETVKLCNRNDILCLPGIGSVTEALRAMELGARAVKLFPSEVLGTKFIEAMRRPLPHARIIPTGGVSLENVSEWFKAGAFALGVGSALTAPKGKEKDYEYISDLAKRFVQEIEKSRGQI
jgi:2-dehydro-3-deoxyphosphogluconate aldolase/(4S)-4-hydroxy-2-oxoglutarate aldolase